MAINFFKIKKWFRMLTGKSLLHVEQGIGKAFVPGKLEGYYNDLTNKVLLDPKTLEDKELPKMQNEKGKYVVFATTIFQYGLGCYDLILLNGDLKYIEQFKKCVDWAIDNQDEKGGWDISSFAGKKSKYGAMAQGEGASLLLRAYLYYKNKVYFDGAKKAIDLMLMPLEQGGTSRYSDNELYLMEFMDLPCVLNGWIFSQFGLYDFLLVCNDQKYQELYDQSLNTMKKHLHDYDNGYWSKYDEGKMIASPFYHKLHISQLSAISMIDNDRIWTDCLNTFIKYQTKWWNRKRAFIKKAFQKMFGIGE